MVKVIKQEGNGFSMKRIISTVLALAALLLLCSCGGEKKILHCDNCEKEIEVDASSNMDDSWILYCADCEKALGLDDLVGE